MVNGSVPTKRLASANAQGYTNGTRNECVTLSYTPQLLSYTHTAWAHAGGACGGSRQAGGRAAEADGGGRRRTEAEAAAEELLLSCI